MVGPEVEQVKGGSRKLRDQLLHDGYCSPNIIRAVKPLWVRGTGM